MPGITSNCGQIPIGVRRLVGVAAVGRTDITIMRTVSSSSQLSSRGMPASESSKAKVEQKVEEVKKTHNSMAQMDEEMRQAMEGLAGDGGEHGAELEDGKPVAMKRAVKENMFRYI